MTWYAVSEDGGSSVRITSGLHLGETETGALALNDPDSTLHWLEFVLDDTGRPTLLVLDDAWILSDPDGNRTAEQRLRAGDVVVLPGHALRVSRSIEAPPGRGRRFEVISTDTPIPLRPEGDATVARSGAADPVEEVGPIRESARVAARPRPDPARAPREAAERHSTRSAGPVEDEDEDATLELTVFDPPAPAAGAPAPAEAPREIWTVRSSTGSGARAAHRDQPGRRLVRLGRTALALALLVPAALAVILLVLEGQRAGPVPLPDAEPGPASVDSPDASGRPLDAPAPSASGSDPAVTRNPAPDPALADNEQGETPDPAAPDRAPPGPAPSGQPPAQGAGAVAPGSAAQAPAGGATAPEPVGRPEQAVAAPVQRGPGQTQPEQTQAIQTQPIQAQPEQTQPGQSRTEQPMTGAAAAGAPRPETAGQSSSAGAVGSSPVAATDPRVAADLQRARELLDDGFITYPPGNNAVSVLEALLDRYPDNPAALSLLGDCTTRLIAAAMEARAQGREFEARNTLEEVFGFNPDHAQARALWREWTGSPR